MCSDATWSLLEQVSGVFLDTVSSSRSRGNLRSRLYVTSSQAKTYSDNGFPPSETSPTSHEYLVDTEFNKMPPVTEGWYGVSCRLDSFTHATCQVE